MLLSFVSMCVPSELNPHPFALLTQYSTSEPQEHLEIVWALRQTHTITAAFFMSWPACCFTWSICVFALITTPILLALCSAVRFIQDQTLKGLFIWHLTLTVIWISLSLSCTALVCHIRLLPWELWICAILLLLPILTRYSTQPHTSAFTHAEAQLSLS